jgi:hypothetical protein
MVPPSASDCRHGFRPKEPARYRMFFFIVPPVFPKHKADFQRGTNPLKIVFAFSLLAVFQRFYPIYLDTNNCLAVK